MTEKKPAISMQSKQHLREWLEKSKRRFIVFDALDLVDSFPESTWAAFAETLQNFIAVYAQHRATLPTGFVEDVDVAIDSDRPAYTERVASPIMKGETLEPEELRALIEWAEDEIPRALHRRVHDRENVRPA